jgi:putative ABC transport system permease protein
MGTLRQDLTYALRRMRRSPGFTCVAVLTLALGIGANTAVYSVVNAVLLRPLPYSGSDRLVKIVPEYQKLHLRDVGLSVPEIEDLRNMSDVYEQVCATWPVSANLTGGDRPERIELLAVSPNYFSMLGASAALGRVFDEQHDRAEGFAESVVISDSLWHRLFGADPNVLGRKIQADNDPYTIVGVMPPGFRHPGATVNNEVEIWGTAGFTANPFPKATRNIRLLPGAIAKLKPGVTVEQAKERTAALSNQLRAQFATDYPSISQWNLDLQPLRESLVGNVRPMLLTLLGAVAVMIAIASTNIANLQLARAVARRREIAVRMALGASAGRIVRQMLIEALVLAVAGGTVGVLIATTSLRLLVDFIPASVPQLNGVVVDGRVLLCAMVVTLACGIFFGLVPALQVVQRDTSPALREGSQGSGDSKQTSRFRAVLIAAEVAMTAVLLIGAGLLLRTFWTLIQQDPGLNPSHVVTASIWLPAPNDPNSDPYQKPEQVTSLVREITRRLTSLPGVQSAAVTTHLPFTAPSFRGRVLPEGAPQDSDLTAELMSVTPDYFQTLQLPFVRGERFRENDKQDLVIIDETAARRFWPGENPLGKRINMGQRNTLVVTVAGVVRDAKQDGLDAASIPHIYRSMYRTAAKQLNVIARTALPAATLEPQIRRAVQAGDPNLPVFNVRGMDVLVSRSVEQRRLSAQLVAAFAGVALFVAMIGIYGLLAFIVTQRQSELAMRIALGAQRRHIKTLVLSYGLRVAGIGVAIGVVASLVLAKVVSSLLFGVKPWDPLVLISVPILIVATVLAASYLPAWRAASIAPALLLRE